MFNLNFRKMDDDAKNKQEIINDLMMWEAEFTRVL